MHQLVCACLLYTSYLKNTKNMAGNSIAAYRRDVAEFHRHLGEKGIRSPEEISNADIVSYVFSLKNGGRAASTVPVSYTHLFIIRLPPMRSMS